MKYLGLGKRLKKLREARSLGQKELADSLGISLQELESYETDREVPRIGTLIKISKLLGVNVADVFRDRPAARNFELIRKAERQKIHPLFQTQEARVKDYIFEPLTLPSNDKHLDAYLIEVPPHQIKRSHPDLTHPGEEFVYLLEGQLKAEISGEEIVLQEGDALFLRSEQPHLFYNPYEMTARALTVIYPF